MHNVGVDEKTQKVGGRCALDLLVSSPSFRGLRDKIESCRALAVVGLIGSSKPLFVAAIREAIKKACLVVLPNCNLANNFFNDLRAFTDRVYFLPRIETDLYGDLEEGPQVTDLVFEKINVLERLAAKEGIIVVAELSACLEGVPEKCRLSESSFKVSAGGEVVQTDLVERLASLGYERCHAVTERGDFAVRGGIIDVFPPASSLPFRIEFFGDKVESIRRFSPATQRSIDRAECVDIQGINALFHLEQKQDGSPKYTIFEYIGTEEIVFLDEVHMMLDELKKEGEGKGCDGRIDIGGFRSGLLGQRIVQFQTFDQERKDLGAFLGTDFIVHHLETHPLPIVGGNIELFYERLEKWLKSGTQVLIYSSFKGQEERIRELLTIKGLTTSSTNPMVLPEEITQGFVYPELNLVLLSDHEVFGYKPVERKYRFEEEAVPLPDVRELKPGDFVVHINYGIGRFIGINNITIEGKRGDFVTLEYADGARLYVPVDQYNLIQRYIGDESHPPALNRLGGVSWDRAKERVKKSARKMAKELLELYAARVALKGFSFSPDTSWQREFEAGFAYEETPDQIRAIKEIKRDMEKDRPMDRLVCGDVGYGKTEVAIRAAFKCIMDNKQVAVLVPTTILADQHYKTFCQRFESFPIRVEMLSRFKTRREQRKIIEDLKTGRVDVVVGTHRLLQKDIQFRDLGLVVVDEEQRFGVSHKEKLKKLKRLVDVLTLTATPIPRTLYMSLSGVRDITIINTPIPGRLPIRTFIYRSNPDIIREAVLREMARGGQVFFVHNRIQTIPSVYRMLTSLIPEARVVVAHGQMDKRELERAMMEFLDYRYDVLLSTSIIESGLDIPNVNTIIINDCHRFGLSELYQLRGRVGRSHRLAYAYLLYPPHLALSPQVKKRLQAIKEFTALGSGLALSLRDLEIRGVGNILGPEQSGSIQAVGFDLYCKLLHQTVAELKGEEVEEEISPQILLQCNAFIPESCLPDEDRRFLLYRRMCGCEDEEALNEIRRELQDFCGRELPQEVQNLLDVMSIKLLAKKAGIPKVSSVKGGVELELQDGKGMVSRLTKTLERFPALRLNPRQPNKLFIPLQGKGFKEDAQVLKDVLFNLA